VDAIGFGLLPERIHEADGDVGVSAAGRWGGRLQVAGGRWVDGVFRAKGPRGAVEAGIPPVWGGKGDVRLAWDAAGIYVRFAASKG